MQLLYIFSILAAFACLTGAHPGVAADHGELKHEIAARNALAEIGARGLEKCSNTLDETMAAAVTRRTATLANLQAKTVHVGRDLEELQHWETVSHDVSNQLSSISNVALFGSKPSCILTPENFVGPFFVPGELNRAFTREGQPGVQMILEIQIIDISTCKPVEGMYVDVWAANATGVYSDTDAPGQGGVGTTFLRGVQRTGVLGTVFFDMIVPGHYSGRANHVHVMVRNGVTEYPNGTLSGSWNGPGVHHIGQLYFDEALREEVKSLAPYSSNQQLYISNDQDAYEPSAASALYDPFVKYAKLNGVNLEGGILAWISIGINSTFDAGAAQTH